MGKCEFCGEEVDLPFRCPFCNGYFCIEHRLPENHSCINAPTRTPLGHWKAKKAPTLKLEKRIPEKTYPALPKRRSRKVGNVIMVLGIIVLILGVGLMVFPQSSHEEGTFEIESLGRPVNAFDLGIIPKNVEIRVDYNVIENLLSWGGRLYVVLINTSELSIIDRAWNSRPTKELLYPHYTQFRFDNVDFKYHTYDGPSTEGSLSWVTPYETNYMVLVWLDEVKSISLVYSIRIDATWHPYFTYGIILTIVGFVTAGIGFTYRRYSSR